MKSIRKISTKLKHLYSDDEIFEASVFDERSPLLLKPKALIEPNFLSDLIQFPSKNPGF